MKYIGHRGARGEEPENTMLGFKTALDNGMDGVELDIHISKDGQIIVIHDDTLDRTTDGNGIVSKMPYADIQKADAGKGECIPLLQDVLDLIKPTNAILFIEIKCEESENVLANIIAKNQMESRCIIKCFNHRLLTKIKEINPNIKTACLIVGLPIKAKQIISDANADIISINIKTVDQILIDQCHDAGYKVFIWNANTKEEVKFCKSIGADFLGTDFPSKINNK